MKDLSPEEKDDFIKKLVSEWGTLQGSTFLNEAIMNTPITPIIEKSLKEALEEIAQHESNHNPKGPVVHETAKHDFSFDGLHFKLNDKAGLFKVLQDNKGLGIPVPKPTHRQILKMDKASSLSFNPNTKASDTCEVISTWCLDPEWMHMSTEFSGAKIDTDYDIKTHTATVMIRIPIELINHQEDAGKFMADAHNILEEAESASDFFAAMAIAWSKIENDY